MNQHREMKERLANALTSLSAIPFPIMSIEIHKTKMGGLVFNISEFEAGWRPVMLHFGEPDTLRVGTSTLTGELVGTATWSTPTHTIRYTFDNVEEAAVCNQSGYWSMRPEIWKQEEQPEITE